MSQVDIVLGDKYLVGSVLVGIILEDIALVGIVLEDTVLVDNLFLGALEVLEDILYLEDISQEDISQVEAYVLVEIDLEDIDQVDIVLEVAFNLVDISQEDINLEASSLGGIVLEGRNLEALGVLEGKTYLLCLFSTLVFYYLKIC